MYYLILCIICVLCVLDEECLGESVTRATGVWRSHQRAKLSASCRDLQQYCCGWFKVDCRCCPKGCLVVCTWYCQPLGCPGFSEVVTPDQFHYSSTSSRVNLKRLLSLSCSVLFFFNLFFHLSSLLLSSSTRRRFYPRRSSGQASRGHRCRPAFIVYRAWYRIQFSIPPARRF